MYGVTVLKIVYTPRAVIKSRSFGGRLVTPRFATSANHEWQEKKSDRRRKPRDTPLSLYRESASILNFRSRNFGCKSVVIYRRVSPSQSFPTQAAGEFAAKSYQAHPKTCLCFFGRLPARLSCGVFC